MTLVFASVGRSDSSAFFTLFSAHFLELAVVVLQFRSATFHWIYHCVIVTFIFIRILAQ